MVYWQLQIISIRDNLCQSSVHSSTKTSLCCSCDTILDHFHSHCSQLHNNLWFYTFPKNESSQIVDQRNNKSQGYQFHNLETKMIDNPDNENNNSKKLHWLYILKSASFNSLFAIADATFSRLTLVCLSFSSFFQNRNQDLCSRRAFWSVLWLNLPL